MALLFIDSTYDITLGILNDQLEWRDFKRFTGQKASIILQTEVFNLLQSQGLKPQDISGVVTIAGPGFYTGLRLSEGFADVLKFFQKPLYSFYTYEIPLWCGVEQGVWMTKAYRGEYFFHYWNKEESKNVLVPTKELALEVAKTDSQMFIHSLSALDEQSLGLVSDPISTHDLLKSESKKIFKEVLNKNIRRESFYFRAPEDEFKVSL